MATSANKNVGVGPEVERRRRRNSSMEGVLLGAVEPLDHPVTLGVVGSSLMMSDAERTAQRRCQTAETN